MDLEKLKELIRIFEESELSELEVEDEMQRMRLQKPSAHAPAAPAMPVMPPQPAAQPGAAENGSDGAAQAAAAPAEAAEEGADDLPTVDSPMVGTFYAAPAPGEAPFVTPGDRVDEGQTVCIVEAMKLMNEVGAKFPCIIERMLVENGQPVEFGQPLFAVRPLK